MRASVKAGFCAVLMEITGNIADKGEILAGIGHTYNGVK
jgi:hypothetical protein